MTDNEVRRGRARSWRDLVSRMSGGYRVGSALPQPRNGSEVTMIEIYGASDDCIEVSGCEGADEFYADGKGRWRADLVGPDGDERLRVLAEYDPDGSGCWVISLSQTEEGVPFPDWGNGTGGHPNGYSVLVRIDAPDGTRLDNVEPAPQGSE